MLTPIGVLGGMRGMAFANIGAAWFDDSPNCARRRRASTSRRQDPDLHAGHRLQRRSSRGQHHARSTGHRWTSRASGWWTAVRRTASDWRPSRWASRSTSTGRGGRSSTRTGRTRSSPPPAAQRVPQAAVLGVDRVRLLEIRSAELELELRPALRLLTTRRLRVQLPLQAPNSAQLPTTNSESTSW